jgi:hypothetical protein
MPDRMNDELERRLDAWVASQSADLSPDTQEKIKAMLATSLQPVKPIPPSGRLVLVFLGVFAVCALALIAIMAKLGFQLGMGAPVASITAIVAVGAILFACTLAWQIVPASRLVFPFWLALAVTGLGVVGGMASLFPWRTMQNFTAEGWPCAVMELAIAILAAAIFWLLARRGAIFPTVSLGAGIGGLAVFLAMIVVQTQCMFQQAPHLLVWHAGTAAVFIALGSVTAVALGRA